MKLKNPCIIAVLLATVFGISACNITATAVETIKGDGKIITKHYTEYAAVDFTKIELDCPVDVIIQPGQSRHISFTTDSNLTESLELEVKDNVLHISMKPISFESTKLVVEVSLPILESVAITGSGDIKINSGNAEKMDFIISGSGDIDAANFQVESARINISGSGDAKVWVNKTLNGEVSGSGNILYKGKPTVKVDVTGAGSVKPL